MKNKTLLVGFLIVLATIVVFFVIGRRNVSLISPVAKQDKAQLSSPNSSSVPSVPAYNAPKEIKYGSSTDLQKELESINPEVNDSDF